MAPSSVRKRWLVGWIGGPPIGIANGVLRERTYGRRLSERSAHQVSTVIALIAFAGYHAGLQRKWPLASAAEARRVGVAWLALTVGFEFGFGRTVAKLSWRELLGDYNLARGRTWPLVLAWLAAGPEVVRRLDSRR